MGAQGELPDLAHRVLERSAHLPGDVEIYAEHSRTNEIKVYAGDVEALTTAEQQGIGVRYIDEQRQGYAYTSNLSGPVLDEALAAASENASVGDRDEWAGLPEPPGEYPDVPGLWRSEVVETPIEKKIALAEEAERAALSVADVETVEEAVYVDVDRRVAVVSTLGMNAYGESTFCHSYVSAHARRGDDVQTGVAVTAGRQPTALDIEAVGHEAGEKARALLGASPCPSDRFAVVFDRQVFAALLSILGRALNAEAVLKGRSMFAERLGDRVAAEGFGLVDDGTDPDGPAGAPFDDEGVPRAKTVLIEDGYLRRWLENTYTATRQGGGAVSTGNASRGSYRSSPGVSVSNLKVASGKGELSDLFSRMGDGLYVTDVKGLHSGANPASGDFSVGAGGHLIRGGGLDRPVREVTIATDLPTLLERVVDRAGDARWIPMYGSVCTPSVAVDGITVSGR